MKKSFFWIAVVLTCSCNPSKQIAKAKGTLDKYNAGASYCAEEFPCKDTTYVVIDSTHFDTLYLQPEPVTTIEYRSDTVFKTIAMPGTTRFVTKYIKKDSIIVRRDNARETDLSNQLRDALSINKDAIAERDKQKAMKKKYMWWTGGLGLSWIVYIVGGYFLGRIRKANKIINAAKDIV